MFSRSALTVGSGGPLMTRVRAGQTVTIRVSDVGQAARVERSDEGSVVVRPARPSDVAIDLGGAQAVIEAVDADGLQRIVGTLRRADDDPDLLVLWTSSVDD